jgi:hypothetical protein
MRTVSAAPEDTTPAKQAAKEDKKQAKEADKAEDQDAIEEADDEAQPEPADGDKKGKKKGGKVTKAAKAKKVKGQRKRGPARPYRKLPQDTLDSRIKKLQKRIERTSQQAEEGRAFLSKYTREQAFRDAETGVAAA